MGGTYFHLGIALIVVFGAILGGVLIWSERRRADARKRRLELRGLEPLEAPTDEPRELVDWFPALGLGAVSVAFGVTGIAVNPIHLPFCLFFGAAAWFAKPARMPRRNHRRSG